MMKIAIATTTAFHLKHTATELIRHGNDVTFMSILPFWKTSSYGLKRKNVRSHFLALQPRSTIALRRGGGKLTSRVREALLEAVDKRVAKALQPCDVFIGLSSVAVASARLARTRYNAKVVIERGSSHVLTQQRLVTGEGGKGLSSFYVERELASYEEADVIVVPSSFAAQSFLDEGVSQDKIKVIKLGVDLTSFQPSSDVASRHLDVLFVGQWSYRKGADLIAAALEELPWLRVTHVGSQVDVPFPKSSRFTSLGHIHHSALSKVMRDFNMLILPSREDGFGMVMAEALASGLRVIASENTGAPDLAEIVGPENVILVPPGSVKSLVSALTEQASLVGALGVAFRPPRAKVRSLSWTAYGDNYARLIDDLTGNTL